MASQPQLLETLVGSYQPSGISNLFFMWKCSFALFLRSFALFCGLAFALFCSFASFCVRPSLERPHLGISDFEVANEIARNIATASVNFPAKRLKPISQRNCCIHRHQVLDLTPLNPTPAACHKRKQKFHCNYRKVVLPKRKTAWQH